jgi:biopolymer transport protein ExbB/TolQ
MKSRIIRNQLRIIGEGPIDRDIDLTDDEEIQDLRTNIAQSDAFGWSIVLNRLDRLLALWLGSKDISRVADWLNSESERDSSAFDSTYATVRVLIWAIPIMGFIGTVMGLGNAISGFGDFLAGSAELSQIKDAIGQVTMGLGVAFDTTLLALVLSVFVMFPLSSIQRREETLFVEIDNYLDDSLVSHLPSPEQQPLVIENLEDSIEAAFRRYIPDPDRYDEVFTRSIDRAAGMVEERFADLASGYESTLHDLTGRLTSSVAAVSDSLEGALKGIVGDLKGEEEKLLALRNKAADQELDRFKDLMKEIYASADKLAAGYQDTAESLRKTTVEYGEKSLQAADELSRRMEDVTKMAAGIQDLLQIEKAIEKSLDGIAASEDFQQTLATLRQHLTTTDEFCSRLSRPRVIMLREEIADS